MGNPIKFSCLTNFESDTAAYYKAGRVLADCWQDKDASWGVDGYRCSGKTLVSPPAQLNFSANYSCSASNQTSPPKYIQVRDSDKSISLANCSIAVVRKRNGLSIICVRTNRVKRYDLTRFLDTLERCANNSDSEATPSSLDLISESTNTGMATSLQTATWNSSVSLQKEPTSKS